MSNFKISTHPKNGKKLCGHRAHRGSHANPLFVYLLPTRRTTAWTSPAGVSSAALARRCMHAAMELFRVRAEEGEKTEIWFGRHSSSPSSIFLVWILRTRQDMGSCEDSEGSSDENGRRLGGCAQCPPNFFPKNRTYNNQVQVISFSC